MGTHWLIQQVFQFVSKGRISSCYYQFWYAFTNLCYLPFFLFFNVFWVGWAGFFFFFFFTQFCDIEKFGDLFSKNKKKSKKILNQKNKKIPRISQFVLVKNTQNLVEKRNTWEVRVYTVWVQICNANIVFKLTHQFTFYCVYSFSSSSPFSFCFFFFFPPCNVCQIINGKFSVYLSNL